MSIAIHNARLVIPNLEMDESGSVYIKNGKIVALGRKPRGFQAKTSIDAKGLVLMPGIVDLGVRLGKGGEEYGTGITQEGQAALRGGITTVACLPDTGPIIDSVGAVDFMLHHPTTKTKIRVIPIGALTKQLAGEEISEMASLKNAGCIGVGNAWQAIRDTRVIRRAFEYAASNDLTVYIHPEDHALMADGCAHEGMVATRLGLIGIPEAAETVAIGTYLPLIEHTGVRAHFCRLSTRVGQNMIRRAQYDGANITADVSINQLFLTEMDLMDFNPLANTRPPLRSQLDKEALRAALGNGSINVISSDHIPLSRDSKLDAFPSTLPGISGFETLLSLTLKLVEEKVISLIEAVRLLSSNPGEIAGGGCGKLFEGAVADLMLFDPNDEWQCNPDAFTSLGKNSPYAGWSMPGTVQYTIANGKIAYKA